jgi:LacI family transcriptional regulator
VESRQSTEILAIADPSMALALRYIREQSLHGCTVTDVARFSALSRSVLERRFQKYLRRSPQAEIRNVQIARVKQLLLETDHKLADIAALCGFKHPEYLNVMFKRVTGQNPGEYRETMTVRKTQFTAMHSI